MVLPRFRFGLDFAKPESEATINPFPHLVCPEAGHRVSDALSSLRFNYVPLPGFIEVGTVEANPISSIGGREVYP